MPLPRRWSDQRQLIAPVDEVTCIKIGYETAQYACSIISAV